ncbi:MAG: hypothetical protein J0L84_11765 [Verrucomicrobia bacterium]|nr:hypothetical protein [Verrucomicrobiota bacterium]
MFRDHPIPFRFLLWLVGIVLLWCGGTGCATRPARTEQYLAASGFKVIPATTPEQLQHLDTLPGGKISVIKRQGQVYFIYPDRAQKQLYVGNNAQYSAYQNLLLNEKNLQQGFQAQQDETNAQILNAEATAISNDPWAVWGVWPLAPF